MGKDCIFTHTCVGCIPFFFPSLLSFHIRIIPHIFLNFAPNFELGTIEDMISLWQIFLVFAKIGAFTIGGGIPMIAAIKSELVERKWLDDEDFIDIITLAQTAPGLFAVNISILTGHRLRGTKGSVVATIGSSLPPFLIILLVAMFFTTFKDNEYVIKAFKGIRPVVVALIGVPMITMVKATKMRWWSWIVMLSSIVLVCVLKVSPIYILICVIVMALFISWYNNRKVTTRKEGRV